MKIQQAKTPKHASNDKLVSLQLLKGTDAPHSESAEQALLAAILYVPKILPEVASVLDDNAWFYHKHQLIWDAMIMLSNDGISIDNVTLPEHMVKVANTTFESDLHEIGGPAYFTKLVADNISHKNYRDYINIINDAHRRVCMMQTSDELRKAALSYDITSVEAVNNAYNVLDTLADKHRTFTTIKDGLKSHLDIAEEARNNPTKMGIPSGITALDEKIDGFHRRRMYVVAARTHHGKTALLMTTALHAASQGVRVGIFNVADGNKQDVVSRLIGIESGVKSHDILMGRCDDAQYSRYFEASRKVSEYPIYIESEAGMTLPSLLIKARNIKYRYGLDMVCIDYAQEIGIDTSHPQAPQKRVDQLKYIATKISNLAGEDFLNVPILLAAQLNRGAVGRRPVSSDIKGSGAFEQVADVIILPYREDFASDHIEIGVTKNRVTNRMGVIDARIDDASSKIISAW